MKNIVNVYEAVGSNKLKSNLVMLLFAVFVVGTVWVFAETFGYGLWMVGYALIFVGITSFVSFWWSDKIILSLSGARPADRKRDFHFYTVTENLSLAAGVPMPRLYVLEDSSPNAFATGRDPKHAVVCATTGILEKLDRTELEGVIAHELSHIGNYDTRFMSIIAILAGIIVILADFSIRGVMFGGRDRNRGGNPIIMVIALVLMILAPIMAQLIKLAISRRREFLADATGVKLTRYPEGLARALEKIAASPVPLKAASNATAHLYIENPFKADSKKSNWFVKLFNTHPPVEERIRALRSMG